MSLTNYQITLAARPTGFPTVDDFKLVSSPIPEPGAGEVLTRTLFLSVDPYMRGRMNEQASYAANVQIGEVMVGGNVGEVVESNDANFRAGDIVQTHTGWQTYSSCSGSSLRRVDPDLAPVSTALGVLGMPGLTAYFGLLDIAAPKADDVVVVSGAAGAVGSLVGQIAKIKGCRTVGIAGSDTKVAHITDELGFDTAFNYKTHTKYGDELKRHCPDGIDIYFDNVGGQISDAVFPLMNIGGRISVCGQISQYNKVRPEEGPRLLWHFITKRLQMRGFLVFDFEARYTDGLKQMASWLNDGKIVYREDIWHGLEHAPEAFIDMMQGGNIGKRLIKVAD